MDAKDPLASFEGRLGGRFAVHSAADGQRLSAGDLPSPPVFDGLAATPGRLYLALMDGSVLCLAAGR